MYSQSRSPAPVILGGVASINTISLGVVCLHPSWRYRDSPQRSGDFRRCTVQETEPLDILQHIPQGDFAGGSTEVVGPSGATKGTDQTILGELQGMDQARLTPNALSWENVSVKKCQPDDMDGQRSKDAASSSDISVSPRYLGRVLVPF